MSTHETRGRTKQVKGRAKQAVGILTHNKQWENEGSRQNTTGAVEESLGKARRKAGDLAERATDAIRSRARPARRRINRRHLTSDRKGECDVHRQGL